jgi:hypothetical protein
MIAQCPRPRVEIYKPENPMKPSLSFVLPGNKVLQSYQFSLQIGDVSGSFSLSFYPLADYSGTLGSELVALSQEQGKLPLWDLIEIMDIVKIFEETNATASGPGKGTPVFTGVIRTKRLGATANDGGVSKRMTVSGTAVTGLVSQYYVNLDTKAVCLTETMANQEGLSKDLTASLVTAPDKHLKVSEVVQKVWKYFGEIDSNAGQLVNSDIYLVMQRFMGGPGDIFAVDDGLEFFYPLGCIFDGKSTQDFFSLIDRLLPEPLYEKFAYTDMESGGKMRVRIRECPFSPDKWADLNLVTLRSTEVKGYELEMSDREVYTCFYTYLDGYAVEADKALLLSTQTQKANAELVQGKKWERYGYRPLLCHSIGYGVKDGEKDEETKGKLGEKNKQLCEWFGDLDEMLSGTITLAMTYGSGELGHPSGLMPGDAVAFLGGQFYVEGVTHSWSYNSGGEISLSVSRGGDYSTGKFKRLGKDVFSPMIANMNDGISVNRVGV